MARKGGVGLRFDVKVDADVLRRIASPEVHRKALTVLAMRVETDSSALCKVDTWHLQSTAKLASDFEHGEVRWSNREGGRDYARYAYYDPNLGPKSVANKRTSKWFETAKSRRIDSWRRYVENEYQKAIEG